VDVDDAIQRLWPGSDPAVEPLGGGITNRNFRIELNGEAFVLRVSGKDTELLGIDREAERAAAEMAASVGVGPEVVEFLRPEGWLVTRFVEGAPIPPEQMRTPEMIGAVAASVRAIHEGPPIPGRFDPHRVVEAYASTASERGVAMPEDFAWAKSVSDRIEVTRGPQPLVPCHDDLLNANFIFDGERVRIVDWEYAGMGDRMFDLGNLSVKHDFEPSHDEALLEAYIGQVTSEDLAAVRLMRFMGAFFEAMWGVVQQAISELDVDFVAYANENFERLRVLESNPLFGESLERLERQGA
jgi:thiamine kinase-like enzyme